MAIDWSYVFTKYKGKWVAFKEDEQTVIASGKTAKAALLAAQKKGFPGPILAKMPKNLITYIG